MTTGISWTDETWNPVVGCDKVSQGCKFCYAKTLHDMRHKAFLDGKLQNVPQYAEPFETIQLMRDRLTWPLSLRQPKRIFVNSMSDLFHRRVSVAFLDDVFTVAAIARRHTLQILTKRPARARQYLNDPDLLGRLYDNWPKFSGSPAEVIAWPLPNVWIGTSVENQAAANTRLPILSDTRAAVHFVSCEPLLGPVDLSIWLDDEGFIDDRPTPPLDWVIVGGESGLLKQNPRPMHPDWARSLRDQCVSSGVPFHFKQWGDHAPTARYDLNCGGDRVCINRDGREQWIPSVPGYVIMDRVGTKRAGRELDGRVWDEFPAVTP